MKKIFFVMVVIGLIGVGGFFIKEELKPQVEDGAPLEARELDFDYYGWFLVDYAKVTPALKRVRQYTNTAFAYNPIQTKVLTELDFKHIIYVFNVDDTVAELVEKENAEVINFTIPYEGKNYDSGIPDYETAIPNFREKFFVLYRENLLKLKEELNQSGTLEAVDIFYLADEPALHRNIYLDQEFLNRIPVEFNQVFGDKDTLMVFAQNPDPIGNSYPGTGAHLAPPPTLDIVAVDPYIIPEEVSCKPEDIKTWLYYADPYTNISWAKAYNKPVLVTGDAQLRDGEPIDFCYHQATYDILKEDKEIAGLIWFAYDESYKEEDLSGAANNPEFVHRIEQLGLNSDQNYTTN